MELKGVGKDCRLPGVFCDSDDAAASLLCQLSSRAMPCTGCVVRRAWSVLCACVCMLDATVSQARTAKLVEMPFAGQTLVGRMNLVSDGGAHWRRVRMLPAATGGVVWSVGV